MRYKDFFTEVNIGTPVKLVGGVGDATAKSDVDPVELAMGMTVEMEHTNDPDIAAEISLDHLTSDPKYYTKLRAAGLAKELDACNTSSGLGDENHPVNDKKRLGTTITATPGNNIIGFTKTPNGSTDGLRGVPPIVNKDTTVDINIKEIKLRVKNIVKKMLSEGGKLFSPMSSRVTTDEMYSVFDELKKKLSKKFDRFNLSPSLSSKQDHGDVDIIVLPKKGGDVKNIVLSSLQNNIEKNNNQLMVNLNGNIFSILYKPDKLDKKVHIDFISAASEDDFKNKEDYLSYNDFSGMVGVMSRKLNFSYGSEGFFKIFVDKNGQHKYVLITKNLRDGLKMLGFRNVDTNFSNIKSEDDIIEFIKTSPLFDVTQFTSELNHGDLKKMRAERKTAQYVRDELIKSNQHKTIDDEDHFFKQFFPQKYAETEKRKQELNADVVNTAKYTGEWLIKTFNLKPGPQIGNIKKFLNKVYGDNLDNTPESDVVNAVNKFISSVEKLNEELLNSQIKKVYGNKTC